RRPHRHAAVDWRRSSHLRCCSDAATAVRGDRGGGAPPRARTRQPAKPQQRDPHVMTTSGLHGKLVTAVGDNSGTSMDGIDVALIATDGEDAVSARAGATYPYATELRKELQAVIADPERAENALLDDIEAAVTTAHGDAIARFLADNSIATNKI